MLEMFDKLLDNGGPMMIPLLICSVVALTVILERSWFWFRKKMLRDNQLSNGLGQQIKNEGVAEALKSLEGSSDPVLVSIYEGLKVPKSDFEEAVEISAKKSMAGMNRGLGILDTLVTMAPLLGILGTVLGIIDSFDLLGDLGLKDPSVVTKGISEALISTAAGLIVALFALLPVNFFRHHTQNLLKNIEITAGEIHILLNNLENRDGY